MPPCACSSIRSPRSRSPSGARWRSWYSSRAALTSKEHTLTLPVLLLLLDLAWVREGWRKNALLYGMMAAAGAVGAFFVARLLIQGRFSAGFSLKGLSPDRLFRTRKAVSCGTTSACSFFRWVRTSTPTSRFPEAFWTAARSSACWLWRQSPPRLGSIARDSLSLRLGVAIFFLLIAPTSSIVPIGTYNSNGVYTCLFSGSR